MKLSTELLIYELRDNRKEKIIFCNAVHHRDLYLETLSFFTGPNDIPAEKTTVYLCRADDLPPSDLMGNGCCVICAGLPAGVDFTRYRGTNLIVLENHDLAAAGNCVLRIFEKYNDMEKQIDTQLRQMTYPGDRLLDLFGALVGAPLCMMDANYNTYAFTRTLAPVDDKLWDYLIKGYGYHYYDIVIKSKPRLEDVARTENGEMEIRNNIGGHFLRIKAIYSNGFPIAFLGMHALKKEHGGFAHHTVQLFDYAASCLQRNTGLLKQIQKTRGKPHEKFLEDLLSGGSLTGNALNSYMDAAKISSGDFYQLGLVYFDSETPAAYNHTALMNYIENFFTTSLCVKHENNVIIMTSLSRDEVFSRKIKICNSDILTTLFENCNARVIFSWPFESILDTPYIYQQLVNIKDFPIIKASTEIVTCYDSYAIALVMNQMQKMHIIGVLSSSIITSLVYYDKVNNTELYITLKEYIKNKCSIVTTAEALHLHRNTLQYRLRQIEALTDVDLNDAALRNRLIYALDAADYTRNSTPPPEKA